MGGPSAPPPQVPQLDPNIQTLSDQQLKTAQQYQTNAAGLMQEQGNMAQDQNAQALSGQTKNITNNANSRGLLYSGIKQGAVASAQGNSAANTSAQQAGINQNVTNQANTLNAQALQSQMGVQNLVNQRNSLAYNIANQ